MLSYVNSYKPNVDRSPNSWNLLYRFERPFMIPAQAAAIVVDIALGILATPLAVISKLGGLNLKTIENCPWDGMTAFDTGLPALFRSVIDSVNPHADYYDVGYGNLNLPVSVQNTGWVRHPLFVAAITGEIALKIFEQCHKHGFVLEMNLRYLSLVAALTAPITVGLDLASAPLFVGLSLITFGQVERINSVAVNSLCLINYPLALVLPWIGVISPTLVLDLLPR
jgi:hypothetical protein